MLLVDCGNRAVKCRLITSDQVQDAVFFPDQADALQAFINDCNVDLVYLASVAANSVTEELLRLLERSLPDLQVERLLALPELGQVKNAYRDYRQLGVDRWLTLLGAHDLSTRDVMIVDAGSAITIDLLTSQGNHEGGAILPGFNTSAERFKSLFPQVDFAASVASRLSEPGQSTTDCLCLPGDPVSVEMLQGMLADWSAFLQQPVEILLCGQDAKTISQGLNLPHRIVGDLVFRGMLQQIQLQG